MKYCIVPFQKRSFVVMKDEIDSIINCGPHDGSSPFLERMYKCLTQNGWVSFLNPILFSIKCLKYNHVILSCFMQCNTLK
jgi:hypothetical protein